MVNDIAMQGVYVDIPMKDWNFFKELVIKMGWKALTKEEILNNFISSRADVSPLNEEDINEEVRAIRYAK